MGLQAGARDSPFSHPSVPWHLVALGWSTCVHVLENLFYMFWSATDLRLGWEGVFSVRDNSVFMGQG